MTYDFDYDVAEGVATLTFNRPEVLNALTFDIYAQYRDLLEDLRYDESVRVIVVTGAGDS
ncbi:MAG: enoyl-CoA hydratase-related protein, partial [Anaerolineae bacterium]